MAKATGVKKGSKLNFYKFVDTEEPKGKGSNPFGATTHFNNNTTAINQIGESVNGLISMVAELKQLELARLEQMNKNKPTLEPEPKDDKKKKGNNPLVNFAKNASKKSGDFLSGILGMLGNMLKMFIAIPALMWLADPANKEKLITVIKVLSKIGKFIFDFMKFGVLTLMDGLYNMFKSDGSVFDRILGFGKALVGFATVFLGIRWLKNPLKLIKDIRMVVPKLIKFVTTLISGKGKSKGKGLVKGIINVATGKKGRAAGGYIPLKKAASGGWISGPQTGYPVSLDGGMTTSFIGHGTEYVSQKADGGAFVVPFDTPATRRTPSLTNTRMKEAKRLGFADGGLLNITPPTFNTNNNNNATFNNNNNTNTSNTTTNNISQYSKGGDISQKFLNNSQTSIDNTTNEYTKGGEITDKFLDNSKTFINEYSKGGRTLINNTTLKNNRTSTSNTTTNQYSKGGEVNNEFLYLPQTNMDNPLDTFQDQSYNPPIGNTVNYNPSPINNFSRGGDYKPLVNFAVGGKVNNISNFSTGGSVSNINTQPISISTEISPMVQRTKIGMGFSEGGQTPKVFSASTKSDNLTKQTETRNESVNEVKTASMATLEATAATVMEVNTKNAQAIEQARSATAGGGGEPETIVQGLPGSGTVNVNGVLKTTATVLNSNNNYMKGLIK